MNDQEKVRLVRNEVHEQWKPVKVPDCVRFIYQELGELDSLLMRYGFADDKSYARNNHIPHQTLAEEIDKELSQVYLMLLSLANHITYDLSGLLDKELDRILKKWGSDANLSELQDRAEKTQE